MTETDGRPVATDGGTEAGDDAPTDDEEGKRQLRLLGAGFVLSGAITYLLAGATDPRGTVVLLLGFLGVAALVLEKTQGATVGVSMGLLSGGFGVWLWPYIRSGGAGYDYLGVLMVGVGLVNVLLAPVGLYFRRLGRRLGGGE